MYKPATERLASLIGYGAVCATRRLVHLGRCPLAKHPLPPSPATGHLMRPERCSPANRGCRALFPRRRRWRGGEEREGCVAGISLAFELIHPPDKQAGVSAHVISSSSQPGVTESWSHGVNKPSNPAAGLCLTSGGNSLTIRSWKLRPLSEPGGTRRRIPRGRDWCVIKNFVPNLVSNLVQCFLTLESGL